MTEIHNVDPDQPEDAGAAVGAVAKAIRQGQLVIFPTETVYGLAAAPQERAATERIFDAKERPARLDLPVLAGSVSEALALAEPTGAAEALAAAFWPGPLTMVIRRSRVSAGWYLGAAEDTIGIRVPGLALAREILRRTGPLATTSANVSGRPPLLDGDALRRTFGDSVAVYLVVPPGVQPPHGLPSTVVDLTSPSPATLREGPISAGDVARALRIRAGLTG
jgi:L-threonylcarbamoyladenylate synthase